MKNKKIILIAIAIVVIIAVIIVIIKINNNANKNNSKKLVSELNLEDIFEIENLEKSNIQKTKNINETIASKYITGTNIYVADAKIKFDERVGKAIFVREDYNNLNVYQTSYKIDEDDSITEQVQKYMNTFTQMCTDYIGIVDEKPEEERLYGESTEKFAIPLEESIYLENRLYSVTYKSNDMLKSDSNSSNIKDEELLKMEEESAKKYDINFYRLDNFLVCEFVNVL